MRSFPSSNHEFRVISIIIVSCSSLTKEIEVAKEKEVGEGGKEKPLSTSFDQSTLVLSLYLLVCSINIRSLLFFSFPNKKKKEFTMEKVVIKKRITNRYWHIYELYSRI